MPALALVGALSTTGCGSITNAELNGPVTLVPTRTPGVTYVIVRPHFPQTQRAAEPNPNSEYLLVCDARPADGMHCQMPTEAATTRLSKHPNQGKAAAPFDAGIATLPDLSIKRTSDDTSTPKPPATAAPTASVMAPVPPPSEPPPPTKKDEKKDDPKKGNR